MNAESAGHIALPHGRLYWRAVGSGMPLVVLHGGPDFNHRYLLPELDRLARGRRLIYYDQRGRGRSARDVAAHEVCIDSEVDDLERVRQHFELDTLSLVGHSWGCVLAMEYAARHPGRAKHLVLMNSAPASHADALAFVAHRERCEPDTLAAMRAIASTRAYIEGDIDAEAAYYRKHFGATLCRVDLLEAVVARLRIDFTSSDILLARAIEARLHAETLDSPDWNVAARLRQCAARTLVIHGDDDFIPDACAIRIAEEVGGAQFRRIEGCGHFAYVERPDDVFRMIEAFLEAG